MATSETYLPKDPSNTSGVNNTGHSSHEQLRLDFLRRFIEHPSLFSVVLTVQQYLNTTTLNTSGVFDFAVINKVWRKDGIAKEIYRTELFVKICNYESESFMRDVVLVVLKDIDFNTAQQKTIIDAQDAIIAAKQAIIDDENATQEQKDTATTERDTAVATQKTAFNYKYKFDTMKRRLNQYTVDFLNYNTITNEIINTLEVLMATDV
jgi:hypothetical protein